MIAVDTSVAVAAFGEWHDLNEPARAMLDAGAAIPAYAYLETYSVLTGFPPPHRAASALVLDWLDSRFSEILEPPPAGACRGLVATLASADRTGGAVNDGVVGLTAKLSGAELVSADQRARSIYDLVGVTVRPLTG